MRDPNAGKYQGLYQREFDIAAGILKNEPGSLEWSSHDYQAFTFKSPDVSLVFYPHKTRSGHRHIRVRNQNSTDKAKAAELMRALDDSVYECTFRVKTPLTNEDQRG